MSPDQEAIRDSLMAIGMPRQMAEYIATQDEREEAARQRMRRLAEYDGPVVFSIAASSPDTDNERGAEA